MIPANAFSILLLCGIPLGILGLIGYLAQMVLALIGLAAPLIRRMGWTSQPKGNSLSSLRSRK